MKSTMCAGHQLETDFIYLISEGFPRDKGMMVQLMEPVTYQSLKLLPQQGVLAPTAFDMWPKLTSVQACDTSRERSTDFDHPRNKCSTKVREVKQQRGKMVKTHRQISHKKAQSRSELRCFDRVLG